MLEAGSSNPTTVSRSKCQARPVTSGPTPRPIVPRMLRLQLAARPRDKTVSGANLASTASTSPAHLEGIPHRRRHAFTRSTSQGTPTQRLGGLWNTFPQPPTMFCNGSIPEADWVNAVAIDAVQPFLAGDRRPITTTSRTRRYSSVFVHASTFSFFEPEALRGQNFRTKRQVNRKQLNERQVNP